jgi:hypothetical protein
MNDSERLQLQKMIKTNDTEDNTVLIRSLQHSKLILADVNNILSLKKKYAALEKSDPDEFSTLCSGHANFIFTTYTDIFNKVIKNEINLDTLLELINVLKSIEEGACDQHEGSFAVGKILKEMYIDSALIKSENNDILNGNQSEHLTTVGEHTIEEPIIEEDISWKEYRKNML